MPDHSPEIDHVQKLLLQLKHLYQQTLTLMEEDQDYDFLDDFLQEREEALLFLKDHPDALKAIGIASPHLYQELLALEDEVVLLLQEHYNSLRQALHEDHVRRRHLEGYKNK